MSLSEPMRIGLAVSAAAHLVALASFGGFGTSASNGASYVRLDLKAAESVVVSETGMMALDRLAAPGGTEAEKAAEKRRQVFNQFLDDIAEEIHSHRLDFGRTDLVGIAVCAFTVEENGEFSAIRIVKSSGERDIDRISLAAIGKASGRVKRPKLLGSHPINVVQEVRFQYGLR